MKRGFVLFALVVLVLWLAIAIPAGVRSGSPAPAVPAAPAVDDESCCLNPDETDPHWECFNNTCVQVNGCGVNVDCNTCGCDPAQEWACIMNGGDWDPMTCTCSYSCDPTGSEEAYCWQIGGSWDPFTCTCIPPACNPGSPQVVDTDNWSDYYCDGYQWVDCDNTCYTYRRYCQDGSVYEQWTECTNVCFPSGELCGGGGGGDDCGTWYRGQQGQNSIDDCWCDTDWGICCDFDWYCWEM